MGWTQVKTIVVPVDFSEESLAAVDTALQIADSAKALHIIYVLPELSPLEPGEVWETINEASRTEHAQQALRERRSYEVD